jgi:hypothetical protein
MTGAGITAVIFRDSVVASSIGPQNLETQDDADEAARLVEALTLGNTMLLSNTTMYWDIVVDARGSGMVVLTDPVTITITAGSTLNALTLTAVNSAAINMTYAGGGEVRTFNWQPGVVETARSALTIDSPSANYGDLFAAIVQLETLDQEDSRYIDADSARSARAFVSLLSLYNVPAPQLFSHGGDTIVFKWMQSDRATYVTLVDGTASLRGYVSGQPIGPAKSFQISEESELVALMLELGGKRWRAVNTVTV